MKKRTLLFLVFTACLTFFATVNAVVLPPDMEKILQRGELRVGVLVSDIPPFVKRTPTGEPSGYDIEMGQDLARRLGVKIAFNFQAHTFDELIALVNENKIDLATNITPTLERAKYTSFSQPYAILNLALFVNRLTLSADRIDTVNMKQLNDPKYQIGVLQNSAYPALLKETYPRATLVPYTKIEQAMNDVVNGKLMAVFLDQPGIDFWLHHHPSANLYGEVIKLTGNELSATLAVSWQSQHLLQWLDHYLEATKTDGTQARWKKKYF